MEILNEQKLKYLSRRQAELTQLKEASGHDLFEKAVEIGHRLKGNGKTFGFPLISEIGLQLETAGKEQNREEILDGITRLEAEVQKGLEAFA